MEHAIRRIPTEPCLADTLSTRCADLASALSWYAVADSYRALAKALVGTATRHRAAK